MRLSCGAVPSEIETQRHFTGQAWAEFYGQSAVRWNEAGFCGPSERDIRGSFCTTFKALNCYTSIVIFRCTSQFRGNGWTKLNGCYYVSEYCWWTFSYSSYHWRPYFSFIYSYTIRHGLGTSWIIWTSLLNKEGLALWQNYGIDVIY